MRFKCGFSKVDITPPMGVQLAGYDHNRPAKEINDNLYARVIYIETEEKQIALVQTDLISVDRSLCETIKEQTGVLVYCWATHTHSGPGGYFDEDNSILKASDNVFGRRDQEVYNTIITQINKGIENARNDCDNVEIRLTNSILEGVGSNRHDEKGYYIPELLTFEILKSSGKKALIYNFPCHPTVLGKDNLTITADFPGVVANILEGGEDVELCMFLNGAAGNISTRFTRRESTFSEVERLGSIIAGKLKEILNSTKKYEKVSFFNVGQKEIRLEIRNIPNSLEAEKEYNDILSDLRSAKKEGQKNLRVKESQLEGSRVNLFYSKTIKGLEAIDTLLSGIVINHISITGIPGELFNELGEDIKNALGKGNTLVGGYFQDYVGYILPVKGYQGNSYEAFSTILKKGSGEKIVSLAVDLINHIKTKV